MLSFNFRNKPQPYNYCVMLAGGMQHYEGPDFLKAVYGVPGVGSILRGGADNCMLRMLTLS